MGYSSPCLLSCCFMPFQDLPQLCWIVDFAFWAQITKIGSIKLVLCPRRCYDFKFMGLDPILSSLSSCFFSAQISLPRKSFNINIVNISKYGSWIILTLCSTSKTKERKSWSAWFASRKFSQEPLSSGEDLSASLIGFLDIHLISKKHPIFIWYLRNIQFSSDI